MTKAVVFLTTMLLFASVGAVAQNNSSSGVTQSTVATAPTQNATPPNARSNSSASIAAGTTNTAPNSGIQPLAQKSSAPDGSMQSASKEPRTASSAELPQTSTILPLLGLLGLGSLIAGLFARR